MDDVLTRAGIFQGVEPHAVDVLAQALEPAEFARGAVIFAEGEPGDRLYIIGTGKVKIGRKTPDGRENLLMVAGPSDMFGELSIFDPGTADVDGDGRHRGQGLHDGPGGAARVDRQASGDRRAAVAGAGAQAAPDEQHAGRPDLHRRPGPCGQGAAAAGAAVRLAGVGLLRVTHDLTQEEIAQLVGASRETVNKALADFAHRGWLRLEGKSVLILEPERLARRAR